MKLIKAQFHRVYVIPFVLRNLPTLYSSRRCCKRTNKELGRYRKGRYQTVAFSFNLYLYTCDILYYSASLSIMANFDMYQGPIIKQRAVTGHGLLMTKIYLFFFTNLIDMLFRVDIGSCLLVIMGL